LIFYSASSLKQQSTDKHVAPLGHIILIPSQPVFTLSFVNYKKRCTRLAAASDKVYQLLAHDRWLSPGTPASSTTKTGRHDIAESGVKHQNSNSNSYLGLNVLEQLMQIR
jgi:hypothetical protein